MSDKSIVKDPIITRLRWNHADVTPYYAATGYYLQDVLSNLEHFEVSSENSPEGAFEFTNETYDNMINVLNSLAHTAVHSCSRSFFL